MKKYRIFNLLIVGLLLLSSCDDFLDLSPVSTVGSNGFYETADEVNTGVIAIYDGLQDVVETEYAMLEMRSDNTSSKNHEGEWGNFDYMNVDVNSATVSSYWTYNYNTIFLANTILENLSAVTDETTYNQYAGEAYFSRALCHFNLVRAFGDVPLITSVITQSDNEYFSRVSESEVYTQIISDLTAAVSDLPTRSNIEEGRATQGAAQTLLAKVYLEQNNYSAAKSLLEDVISSGDYDLLDDYNDVFYNELNDEIIFAIQYITDDSDDSEIFSYNFTANGSASGLNYPTDDLIEFVSTNLNTATDSSEFNAFLASEEDLRCSTLFYYEPLSGSGNIECGKYRADDASNQQLGGNDWIILRYADVYLMYVEATIGSGTSTSDATALTYFNAIRTRAGLTSLTEVTKDNLLDERRIELAYENQRLFDLIRFGEASSVLTTFGLTEEGSFTFDSDDLLLPIPQSEINVSNGALTQNSGY